MTLSLRRCDARAPARFTAPILATKELRPGPSLRPGEEDSVLRRGYHHEADWGSCEPIAPVMPRARERLRLSRRQRLLSPHSSRPKQDQQNHRSDNTPPDPCDVRVSRLPFENLLVDGHQECPPLPPTRHIVPNCSLSILAFQTSLTVSHSKRQNFDPMAGPKEFLFCRRQPPGGEMKSHKDGAVRYHGCPQIFWTFP